MARDLARSSVKVASSPSAFPGSTLPLPSTESPGFTIIRRRYQFAKDSVPKWFGPEPLSDMLQRQHKKPLKREHWVKVIFPDKDPTWEKAVAVLREKVGRGKP